MLRHVPQVDDARVLVDAATRDDAAVFRLTDDRALVATVDFFAPIVDDPYQFGRIAAANAFSDLFAMGATPLLALNLVAWPRDPDMLQLLGETMRGGADVAREAGALILGGHSIDDKEPKFGMVTIGEAHPSEIVTNANARPGDVLVLTKPLGTGILATGLKRDAITEEDMQEAIRVMAALNADAARAMRSLGGAVHAATDVTGFGLLGHLSNMLESSAQSAKIFAGSLPVFELVKPLIEQNVVPGGTQRNLEAINKFTAWEDSVNEVDKILLADAQTSGGLLIAVDRSRADALVADLQCRKTAAAAVIGEVIPRGDTLAIVTAATF